MLSRSISRAVEAVVAARAVDDGRFHADRRAHFVEPDTQGNRAAHRDENLGRGGDEGAAQGEVDDLDVGFAAREIKPRVGAEADTENWRRFDGMASPPAIFLHVTPKGACGAATGSARQAVFEYPAGQGRRFDPALGRGEQHRAAGGQAVLGEGLPRPFVVAREATMIFTSSVGRSQLGQVFPAVCGRFRRTRGP